MSALSDDAIRKVNSKKKKTQRHIPTESETDIVAQVFVELQAKYVASTQQVNSVKAQIQARQRDRKMAELTRRELDTLEPDTKTYKPIGKMFIQTPLAEMKNQYVKRIKEADETIQQLEKSQKYWERAANDAQGNLKDILQGPRTM
ncbi:Prefoldin [Dichotomocladium elegans]|nr:Prefoldin [Dichotomocladium elegans]